MTHLLLAGILLAAQGAQCPADTKSILPLVAEAIEDELYDLGRQGDYFHIDGTSGSELPAGISMFVDKNLSRNCTGVVIYKNMPVGEVYRYFTVTHGVV